MRITLFILAVASMAWPSFAQITDFPTFHEIETQVADEGSNYYYPHLLQRYLVGDTTMNSIEQIFVYYGYIYQDEYDPVTVSPDLPSLKSKMQFDEVNMPNYEELIALTEDMLNDNPFDIEALTHHLYFLEKIGDEDNAKIIKTRINIIRNAILHSNSGYSMENPMIVTFVKHERVILDYRNLIYLGEQTTMNELQYLKVEDSEQNEIMVYFDIEPILRYMSNM